MIYKVIKVFKNRLEILNFGGNYELALHTYMNDSDATELRKYDDGKSEVYEKLYIK